MGCEPVTVIGRGCCYTLLSDECGGAVRFGLVIKQQRFPQKGTAKARNKFRSLLHRRGLRLCPFLH